MSLSWVQTDQFHTILGINGAPVPLVVGLVICDAEMRIRPTQALDTSSVADAAFGQVAKLHVLKIGSAETNSKSVHKMVEALMRFTLTGDFILTNLELEHQEQAVFKFGSVNHSLQMAEELLDFEHSSDAAEYVSKAMEYMNDTQKQWMIGSGDAVEAKWMKEWEQRKYPRMQQSPEREWKLFLPFGYQQAMTEEVPAHSR